MKITYILEGKQTAVEAESDRTLLDTALIHQLNPPYSCMEGTCGTCEAWVDGQIVRTCQTLPWSDSLIVNYDKGRSS